MALKKWACVLLLGLVITLYGLGFIMLNPALPSIGADFAVTPQLVGLLLSFYSLPGIFVIPVYGVLCDRYGRRRVLLPLLLLFGLSGVGSAFVTDFTVLLGLRLLQGIASAAFFPLVFIIVGDLYHGDERSQVVTLVSALQMGLSIPMASLGGFLTLVSWRIIFLVSGTAIPICLGAYLLLPETNPCGCPGRDQAHANPAGPGQPSGAPEGGAPAPWPYLVMSIVAALFYLGSNGVLTLFTPYYVELGLGQSPIITGLVLTVQGALVTLFTLVMGWLMVRFSKPVLLMAAFLFLAFSCGVLMAAPALAWLAVSVILSSISNGFAFSGLSAYLLDLTPEQQRGSMTSAYQASIKIGQTVGPYLSATAYMMFSLQFWAPFSVGVWAGGVGFLLLFPLVRYTQRTRLGLPEAIASRQGTPAVRS